MNVEKFVVARRILSEGLVLMDSFNFPLIYFSVFKEHENVVIARLGEDDDLRTAIEKNKEQLVYNLNTCEFKRCTCHHGSFYGVNKPEETCYHVCACREWLKENLRSLLAKSGSGAISLDSPPGTHSHDAKKIEVKK
jgi:hypothetical protein